VNQALEWLEQNQDKPLDELLAADKAKEAENEAGEGDDESKINVEPGEVTDGSAKSLVCNDCGKRFRNADFASYHASKT
jgi:UBX domain-containing protein 1/4